MQRKDIHFPSEWVNLQVHCIQASLAGTGGWCSFVDRVTPVEFTPVAFVLFFFSDKTLQHLGNGGCSIRSSGSSSATLCVRG